MKSSRWTGGGEEASDRSLVEAYRAGDDQAYGELVLRYQIPLFRLLLGLLAVGDEIYADATSVVGSIGVVAAGFGFVQEVDVAGLEENYLLIFRRD